MLKDPHEDEFGINLQGPDNTSEHLDRPWVLEDDLSVSDIETEGVAEAPFNFKRHLKQILVAAGNALVRNANHGKIRILEEAVIWFFHHGADKSSLAIFFFEIARLRFGFLALLHKDDLAAVLILDSTLNILRIVDRFNFDARARDLLTVNGKVNVNTHRVFV